MKAIFRGLLKTLLGLGALIVLGAFAAPYVLDRAYYAGPKTDHFDGQSFFNPDGDDALRPAPGHSRAALIWGFLTGRGRTAWPDHMPVTPSKPPLLQAINSLASCPGLSRISNRVLIEDRMTWSAGTP